LKYLEPNAAAADCKSGSIRRTRVVKACSLLAPLLLGSLAACGGSSSTAALPPAISSGTYSHVIVVIQENRSFDNIFAGAGITGADVATSGYNSVCSDPNVVTTCGQVPLVPLSFNSYGPDHSHESLVTEWNNGLMNGFDQLPASKFQANPIPGSTSSPPLVPNPQTYLYAYLPAAEIHPYVQLATTYSLSDHMFSSGLAPSFPGHVFLVAGRGPAGDPTETAAAAPWGCPEPSTDTVELFDDPPTVPAVAPVYPCFDFPTIADLLDAKGVSWKYYIGQTPEPGTVEAEWDWGVNSFAAIKHIYNSPEYKTKLVPRNNFFSDVAAGTLSAVSWVTPNGNASDHANIALSADGPYWVSEIYEAIAQNPAYYGNTAIIVTWDDSGAWYDHVPPPPTLHFPMAAPYANYEGSTWGMRVPLIFIAANAKPGVSQTYRSFGSILGFIEQNFGLGNLNAQDVGTDALSDLFNPKPTSTIAPIPRSQLLSHARRAYSVEYFRQQPETPADDQ
jgi:phospholipase C